MSIQNIRCTVTHEQTLCIEYKLFTEVSTLSVCLAKDSEFTDTVRHFVYPNKQSVTIDIGCGTWYIRIGSWEGTDTKGTIEWSSIYGPITIDSPKPALPDIPFVSADLPILHKQNVLGGIRLHTGLEQPQYIVMSLSEDAKFPASLTKFRYAKIRDVIEWIGFIYPNIYNLKLQSLGSTLPTDSIHTMNCGYTFHRLQCVRPLRPGDSGLQTASRSESVLLRDNEGKSNVHFSSYNDYIRYKAGKAKFAERKSPL
jgi:hypothetical protein